MSDLLKVESGGQPPYALVIDPDLWGEVEVIMIPPQLRLQLGHLQTWEWEHWHPGSGLRTVRRGFTDEHTCRSNAMSWTMMSDVHDHEEHVHNTDVRLAFCWAFLITDLEDNVVEFQTGFTCAEDAKRAARRWIRQNYHRWGPRTEVLDGDIIP